MSAVTLETLRADYEAARDLIAVTYDRTEDWIEVIDGMAERGFTHPTWHMNNAPEEDRMVTAACCWVIARDYGIQAARFYKLSDGRIDPRGAA